MHSRTLGLHAAVTSRTKVQLARSHDSESNRAECPCSHARHHKNGIHKLSASAKPTVIIVDDDLSMRRALQLQLRVAGLRVRVFDSVEKFLTDKLPSANTCLLLDIYMPGKKGIELWEQLAADGRRMPTVLMSGRDDEETKALVRSARGVTCLFKPFDQSALLRAIRKALHDGSKSER
jgi:FixJ family two-component response regulator